MLALVTAALAADDGTSCPATPPTDLSEALASYDREGYAVVRSAIDADLLAEVRQHVEHLFARYPTVPPEHLHHLLMRNDPFWIRLASDPRLLRLADEFAPFIDGDVALFASHYFCKMPHAGKAVLWHQDGSYWPLRPMNVLTLYLAVDDADEENGCLQIVPGSHRWDLAELTNSSRDGSDVLGSATHTDQGVLEALAARGLDAPTSLRLRAGDVEVHHPNLVHKSEPNRSDRRRCALTLRYISPRTECWDPAHPVMMMRGDPVAGINTYRSWPTFRDGHDMPFRGAAEWNASRRIGTAACEAWFARTDHEAMDRELEAEVHELIDGLGR